MQPGREQSPLNWTPLDCTYRGCRIVSAPPPSSGGITFCEILNIASGWDLGAARFHSPRAVHLALEAMRWAFLDRNTALGDPDFMVNPVGRLLSAAASRRRGRPCAPSPPIRRRSKRRSPVPWPSVESAECRTGGRRGGSARWPLTQCCQQGERTLTFHIDKENAMAMARTLAAAPRWAPVVGSHRQIRFRRRSAPAFRRLLG